MIKKMTLLAMVVGVVAAFAAPGMANAAQLTQPAGTPLAVGTTITATSTNTITKTNSGLELKCKKVIIHANVTINSGGEVVATMDGANDTTENCEIVNLGAVSIDPTLNSLSASGSSGGTSAASFTFNVTGVCEASSTASKITWTSGTDVIHLAGPVTGTCGAGTIAGDFTLETVNSKGGTTPVLVD